MQIILFGAPGVGKGTQAKILADKFRIKHISTGDILREAISNGSEIGLKAKSIMDSGELVPDEIMSDIIKDAIDDAIKHNGFILDGFPRTVPQAKLLDKIFEELSIPEPILIILKANDPIIVNRLSQRRACEICGTIVNLNDLPEKSICPSCGATDKFITRNDDKEEVILNRLEVYRKTTRPVVQYFEHRLKVIRLDGTLPIEEVTENIMNALD